MRMDESLIRGFKQPLIEIGKMCRLSLDGDNKVRQGPDCAHRGFCCFLNKGIKGIQGEILTHFKNMEVVRDDFSQRVFVVLLDVKQLKELMQFRDRCLFRHLYRLIAANGQQQECQQT